MSDAAAAVIWLLANALLVATAYRLSRHLFPADGTGATIAHVVVLCWACIVACAIVLGSFGVLSPALLLAGVCGCCLIARLVLWRKILEPLTQPREIPTAEEILEAGKPSCQRLFDAQPRENGGTRAPSDRRWFVAWGALGSLLGAHVILNGILSFPKDWDTLAYHLPLIDHWIREGTLYVPQCAFWYCPGNHEILGLWIVAPFSGDFLIALNNLPAILLLAAASVELAALLGVSRPVCHLAGMAVVATELTLRQMVSCENDVAAAALFLTALVYGLRFARGGGTPDLFLAGASVGLLVGIKYYALLYAVAAGASLLVIVAVRRSPRDVLAAAAVGVGGVLVFGAYWYLRNAWFTGAPLFPKGFTESTDLWGRIRPESHSSSLLRNGRAEVWPLYFHAVRHAAGPVHLAATALVPLVLLGSLASGLLPRRRSVDARQSRLWLPVVLGSAALVGALTPNVVETVSGTRNMLQSRYHSARLTLPLLSLCVVALAVPLSDVLDPLRAKGHAAGALEKQRLERRTRRWTPKAFAVLRKVLWWSILAAIAAAVAYQATTHLTSYLNVDLLLMAWDLFLLGLLLAWSGSFLADHRRTALLATALMLAVGGWTCQRLAARWHTGFTSAYQNHMRTSAFGTLAEVDAARERLCVADNCYYPFFGSRRQYDVSRPLYLPDYDEFLAYLRRHRTTMVVTCNSDSNPHRRYVDVANWLGEHPETFQITYADRRYTWARVLGGEEQARVSASVSNRGGTP